MSAVPKCLVLPHDAMHSVDYAVASMSVDARLSITRRYSVEMAKYINFFHRRVVTPFSFLSASLYVSKRGAY